MSKNQNMEKLRELLKRKPAATSAILAALGISQPTFSRLWSTVRDGVALGAGKNRQYALRRHIPGVEAPVPLFRVLEDGKVEQLGQLHLLEGGFYALTPMEGTTFLLYEGMPYFLHDLRPQGFLGRMEPGKHPELGLPADILRWTAEQVLIYLSHRSEHAAGNLILGNESLARHVQSTSTGEDMAPESERAQRYPRMAEHAMQGEAPGSSAGGEQPKFTALVDRMDGRQTIEHVIVKFSPKVDSRNGRRWGDLLVCEHLALEVLDRHGIAAARTSILEGGDRVFLEVVRFDRAGLKGRRPMATFAALDGDLGMMDKSWTAVAHELGHLKELPSQDIETVEILDLYGALIGNTDKHHGNIAVAWTLERRHRLLDAYDMLPMLYRPNTHGEIVAREWKPDLSRLALRHLALCHDMASQFWQVVLDDQRISPDFKETVAWPHLATLRTLTPAMG